MEETIISINGPNIMSLFIMIVIIFAVVYGISLGMAKMKAGGNA